MAEFSDDEVAVIKELISDHGSDCPYLDSDRLRPLAEKLGVWEPEQPPTPEELARREEFRNSPLGKMMAGMFKASNEHFAKQLIADAKHSHAFFNGTQWSKGAKIGTTLRIRLPNDFTVVDANKLHVNKDGDK